MDKINSGVNQANKQCDNLLVIIWGPRILARAKPKVLQHLYSIQLEIHLFNIHFNIYSLIHSLSHSQHIHVNMYTHAHTTIRSNSGYFVQSKGLEMDKSKGSCF